MTTDSSANIEEMREYSEAERLVEAAYMPERIGMSLNVCDVQKPSMVCKPSGSLAMHGPVASESVRDLQYRLNVPVKCKHSR